MRTAAFLALALTLGTTGAALAVCPAPLAGDTPEVLAANQQRLLCLQREIESDAANRMQDLQFRSLDSQLQALELQRRFDQLPVYQPPVFEPPVFRPPTF